MTIALIVIASLATAGIFNGVVTGVCLILPATLLLLCNIVTAYTDKKYNKKYQAQQASAIIRAIVHIAAIVLGSLAIAGVLPAATVGVSVLVPLSVSYLIRCGIDCIGGSHLVKYFWRRLRLQQ